MHTDADSDSHPSHPERPEDSSSGRGSGAALPANPEPDASKNAQACRDQEQRRVQVHPDGRRDNTNKAQVLDQQMLPPPPQPSSNLLEDGGGDGHGGGKTAQGEQGAGAQNEACNSNSNSSSSRRRRRRSRSKGEEGGEAHANPGAPSAVQQFAPPQHQISVPVTLAFDAESDSDWESLDEESDGDFLSSNDDDDDDDDDDDSGGASGGGSYSCERQPASKRHKGHSPSSAVAAAVVADAPSNPAYPPFSTHPHSQQQLQSQSRSHSHSHGHISSSSSNNNNTSSSDRKPLTRVASLQRELHQWDAGQRRRGRRCRGVAWEPQFSTVDEDWRARSGFAEHGAVLIGRGASSSSTSTASARANAVAPTVTAPSSTTANVNTNASNESNHSSSHILYDRVIGVVPD